MRGTVITGVLTAMLALAPHALAEPFVAYTAVDLDYAEPCAHASWDGESSSPASSSARFDGGCEQPPFDVGGTIPPPFGGGGQDDPTSKTIGRTWIVGEVTVGLAYGSTTVLCVTIDPEAFPPNPDMCYARLCQSLKQLSCEAESAAAIGLDARWLP